MKISPGSSPLQWRRPLALDRSRPADGASGQAEPLEKNFKVRGMHTAKTPKSLFIGIGWNQLSAFLAVDIAFIHNQSCGIWALGNVSLFTCGYGAIQKLTGACSDFFEAMCYSSSIIDLHYHHRCHDDRSYPARESLGAAMSIEALRQMMSLMLKRLYQPLPHSFCSANLATTNMLHLKVQ